MPPRTQARSEMLKPVFQTSDLAKRHERASVRRSKFCGWPARSIAAACPCGRLKFAKAAPARTEASTLCIEPRLIIARHTEAKYFCPM